MLGSTVCAATTHQLGDGIAPITTTIQTSSNRIENIEELVNRLVDERIKKYEIRRIQNELRQRHL